MKNRLLQCLRAAGTAIALMSTVLQTPAQTQDGMWQTYDSADFSFQYPSSWQVYSDSKARVAGATDSETHGVDIRFVAGAQNKADTFSQCASEDQLLDFIYKTQYETKATSTDHYPFTSVTHDDYKPGFLGGRSTTVSVVYQEAYKNPLGQLHLIEVVPRAGGMYIITYWHIGEPMEVSEPLRRRFARSVVLKSGKLDKNAYCNYLGK